MTTVRILSDADATPEARAVFDDIRKTRNTDFVNNAWRAMANHPKHLARQWHTAKEVMAPGSLDALTKELVYLAVSIMNNCEYCIHSHSHFARQKGMTDAQYSEFLAVIDLATAGNRMMTAMQVPVDDAFKVK